jgi:hypothetical protein
MGAGQPTAPSEVRFGGGGSSRERISILLSAYGRSPYLTEAIRSVQAQRTTRPPQELILLTDRPRSLGSSLTIGPSEVPLKELLVPEPRKGPFFARGIEACSGEVICFLNDDDLWEPEKLESVERHMLAWPEVGLHRTGVHFVSEGSSSPPGRNHFARPTASLLVRVRRGGHWPRSMSRYRFGFNDSSLTLRRECLVPMLPYLSEIEASEDTFFFLSALALTNEMVFDPTLLVRYRLPGGAPPGGSWQVRPEELRSLGRECALRIRAYEVMQQAAQTMAPTRVEVAGFAERGVRLFELLRALLQEQASRAELATRTTRLLSRWNRYETSVNLGASTLGFLSLASPGLARVVLVRAGVGQVRISPST